MFFVQLKVARGPGNEASYVEGLCMQANIINYAALHSCRADHICIVALCLIRLLVLCTHSHISMQALDESLTDHRNSVVLWTPCLCIMMNNKL